jgi:hypothetical protein
MAVIARRRLIIIIDFSADLNLQRNPADLRQSRFDAA